MGLGLLSALAGIGVLWLALLWGIDSDYWMDIGIPFGVGAFGGIVVGGYRVVFATEPVGNSLWQSLGRIFFGVGCCVVTALGLLIVTILVAGLAGQVVTTPGAPR